MKRPKGPELKMPDLKAPPFLADLYYDLRDRRLLPLLALIVVAMAAVPFLLGGDSEEIAPPVSAEGLAQASGAEVDAGTLTVVEATPGLRDYRKRLADRTPTNPFKQRYVNTKLKGAQLPEPTGESASSSTESAGAPATEPASQPISTGGGQPGSSVPSSPPVETPSGRKHGELTLFSYAIKVRITKSGGKETRNSGKQEPIVRERVLPQTALPGKKTPVVTFMGPGRTEDNKATGKALLLVSDKVQSVFGETKCASGTEDVCQLVEAEPGFPVTFVYGANEVRYTVNVLKLGLVITGRKKYGREARMLMP